MTTSGPASRSGASGSRGDLLADLASRIAQVGRPHPVRVAIDGVDAAGKTTLADELVGPLGRLGREVIRASLDRFHNPAAHRYRLGAASPEGFYRDSFDYPALTAALLRPLGPGGTRGYRRAVFDFRSDSPVDAPLEQAAPDAILLFDGVFLLRPELRDFWDLSIFVRADFRVTVARAEQRDAERLGGSSKARQRYERRYVPGQRLYLAEVEPERRASIVIDNNDPRRPVVVRAASATLPADVNSRSLE